MAAAIVFCLRTLFGFLQPVVQGYIPSIDLAKFGRNTNSFMCSFSKATFEATYAAIGGFWWTSPF